MAKYIITFVARSNITNEELDILAPWESDEPVEIIETRAMQVFASIYSKSFTCLACDIARVQ